jgi:hypothetical protein
VSAVILRTVKHRMADLMSKPGGPTIAAALDNADKELATRAGETLENVSAKVTALEGLPSGPLTPDMIEEAYALASDIVDVTGCLNMPELFRAAYNLCDILDYGRTESCSRSAFDVHVQALRLILTHGRNAAIRDLVVRLDAVKDRVLKGQVEG